MSALFRRAGFQIRLSEVGIKRRLARADRHRLSDQRDGKIELLLLRIRHAKQMQRSGTIRILL